MKAFVADCKRHVALFCGICLLFPAATAPAQPDSAPAAAAAGQSVPAATNLPVNLKAARLSGTLAVPVTNAPITGPRPKIQFAQPVFDFGRISSGESVKHDFIFTNAGDAKLVLTAVQPSCGCTAAGEWSREVEPGQTGRIPIQFNSASFNGAVSKSITVVCNDPAQSHAYLQFKGTVWKPIDLNPPFAILNLTPELTRAFTTINVTNNMDQPVDVWDAKVSNPAFSIELRTNTPGKSYSFIVGVSGLLKPGSIQGSVTAKTSATNAPVITATTWANVQPQISLIPQTINLPQAPLANRTTPIISIMNNTTNPLVLTEAEVNVPGVEVKVNEVNPGKYFSVVVNFPPGFELPAGTPVEFKAKSNNPDPRYAELKVPIHQAPRPANAPTQPLPQSSATAPRAALAPPTSVAAPPPSIAAPRTAPPVFVLPPAQSLTPPASIAAPPESPVANAPVRHVLPRTTPPPPPPLPATAKAAASHEPPATR